jgi:predicted O-methyltransferase YrrM
MYDGEVLKISNGPREEARSVGAKIMAWTECFFALRRLKGRSSPAELVDFCMSQPLAPLQVKSELVALANEIANLQAQHSMEIGTCNGGTLFLLCRLARPDAEVISLDQHRGTLGGIRKIIYYSFLRDRQKLHVVTGDSHSSQTQTKIAKKLGASKLDFLFIDGDHSYEGVKRDFEMYSPFVRPGGLIAFHDIVAHPPEANCQVKEFWDEVKGRYRNEEIVENPRQPWAGIGLLYV